MRTRRTTTSPDRTRRPTTSTLATLLVAGMSAAVLAAPAPTSAQVLEGYLVLERYLLEGGSGEPIEGGTVGLFTPRGFTIDIGVSDDDGFFSLQAPDAGTYFMTADATGFVDLTHGEFDLYAGEALSFDVFLRPRPVEIYTSLAQLPVEFRKGGNCGAVVVWTKG